MRANRVIALCCCVPLLAQQPPAPRDEVVFSVTTSLVQVDAVVTDSKGRYITDLTANDFEILEDGQAQKITNLSYTQTAIKIPPAAQPPSPKSVAALPPAPPRREDVRRTIVLMVDDLGMSFESMAFVRYSLRKFVDKQMLPGDLVAICRTAAGSGALQQFTTDKRILMAAIDALRWNPYIRTGVFEPPELRAAGWQQSVPDLAPAAGGQTPSKGAQSDTHLMEKLFDPESNDVFVVGALGAVNYIVRALREMPGRKSIVLLSDGLKLRGSQIFEALHSLVDRANRAGTVIYTMQTTGLQTLMPNAQDYIGNGGMPVEAAQKSAYGVVNGRHDDFNMAQQGLGQIAYQTGGLAYQNGNDLNWGLDRVLEDQQGYYLIGYKPATGTFDEKRGTRSYHKITVKVTRAGLHVRSRTGFFGATDDETRPRYDTPLAQLHAAMVSPFQSSAVHLRLTALYAEAPKRGPLVRNLLHIDARDLTFNQTPDGSGVAKGEILAIATGADDQPVATLSRPYEFRAPMDKLQEDQKEGALYTLDVPIRRRGAYQIHVAVRDAVTGKVGSASQFLVIPNLKKDRVVLTSVVLAHQTINAAARQFHAGGQVEYFCMVEKGGGNLDAQIRIVRDGRNVYSGPAKLTAIEGGGFAIMGILKLAQKITPGNYYLGVIARDRKSGIAAQWTDFEILP